jgi:undecaprenyl diphosphate synthase
LKPAKSESSSRGPTPADREVQDQLKSAGPIPKHVAVIMDGNGRWAADRGKPRVFGHRAGVEAVRDTVRVCGELGIGYLTLYTFSTENWQRPRTEVDALMRLLVQTTRREVAELLENNVQLNAIGNLSSLPASARRELADAIEITSSNDGLVLTLAISYSGRWEIVEAARNIAREVAAGQLQPDSIDEEMFSAELTTAEMPDPDLLVRTGGEMRISNFLLWQLAYSELYVTPTYWPDFRREHLYAAIRNFHDRERRFGRVSPVRTKDDG